MHFSQNKPNNYRNILIDGVSILELGARVLSIPAYIRPKQRIETVRVPGRSGVLTYNDGSYDEVTYSIKLYMDGDPERVIHRIASGSRLVMSTQPEYEYRYRIEDSVELDRTLVSWHEGEVPFICYPFRHKRGEQAQDPARVRNDGNLPCCPSFLLEGSGDITLSDGSGQELIITGVDKTVQIIGGETGAVLVDGKPSGYKVVGGLFEIPPGKVKNYTATNARIAEVKANWRWV